jgi:hypothetical protein
MLCCIVHNNLRKISGKQLPKKFCFLSLSCIQKQQQEDNLHIYTKSSASWAFVASPEAATERQSACIYASTFATHEHYRSNPTAAFNDMYMGMVCLCEVPFTMSHAFMRNPQYWTSLPCMHIPPIPKIMKKFQEITWWSPLDRCPVHHFLVMSSLDIPCKPFVFKGKQSGILHSL